MGKNNGINYNARTFIEVRTELINFVKQYYPDLFSDFNDASVGQMLLELNAAVADMLSFNTDRTFQETQIEYAQERSSVLSIGRTLGLKIPGVRPSMCLVDFRVTVPPMGDTFNDDYSPILRYGSEVEGGGQIFQVDQDIDFSSPLSAGGIPNRLVVPNIDANSLIVSYDLIKREAVINGKTRILKRNIRAQDLNPFMEIILPETNVISVEQVKMVIGLNSPEPTLNQYLDFDNRFYEVDSLADSQVFIEDKVRSSDNRAIKSGKWVEVSKRFVADYTDRGFCRLTFGSGTSNSEPINDYISNSFSKSQVQTLLNNTSLGELPNANSTLYIRYTVGGGQQSNIGPNVLQNKGLINMLVTGTNAANNAMVETSLRLNNVTPAIGGGDAPTVEELRNLIKYNFASQNRAVTVRDYVALISKMSSKFGVPFKTNVGERQNKIEIATLSLGPNRKLSTTSTSTLRENISRYLANYRMINDYISIVNGTIINLGVEVYCYINKDYNKSLVITEIINAISDYFDVNGQTMGQNIYLSDLSKELNLIDGVLNIIEMKIFNKIGGQYALGQVIQSYANNETNEIDTKGNLTLFGNFNTMFEIKYPTSDIRVIVN
jgi:hypothetical protein